MVRVGLGVFGGFFLCFFLFVFYCSWNFTVQITLLRSC